MLVSENITGRNIYITFNDNEIFSKLVGLKIKLKSKSKLISSNIYKSWYKRTRGIQFRKLKRIMQRNHIDVYGMSHILLANYMFTDIPLHLFEDGVSTLISKDIFSKERKGFSWWLDNFSNRIYPKSRNYWQDRYEGDFNIVEYFYTLFTYDYLKPTNPMFKCINLKQLWDNKSKQEKLYICNVFNVDMEEVNKLPRNASWLFTQTLSEDGFMSENEKIELYKAILSKYNSENIIIKPHPREKTNYKNIFPDTVVFDGACPTELLACMGLKPKRCITVCSTAVFIFYKQCSIDFYGKEVHPKLMKDNNSLDHIFKRNAFL